MTNFEFQILSFIRSNRAVRWSDLLERFGSQGRINEVHRFLHRALNGGWIVQAWRSERPPNCTIKLTAKGVTVLNDFQPDKVKEDRVHLKQGNHRIGKIIAVIVGIAGFLASLVSIIEFFAD